MASLDAADARLCYAFLIHSDHNHKSYSPCPENDGLGSSGIAVSFTRTRRGVTRLVDMSLHTTREARFTDGAAARGVFVAHPTSQTLCQSAHRSGLDTGEVDYTHDQYGAFVGSVFAFCAASFAHKARLLLFLSRGLKIAHHVGCLCEMSDRFVITGGKRTRRSS
jgi:hypothetical protein